MTFRFQEGDEVVLKNGEDHSRFLRTGSHGVVFCQYTTTPPAYEVNFEGVDGKQFGSIMFEDDIEAAQNAQPLVQREAVGANS